ncbi:MAG: Uncharacterized protein AUREO_006960 [Aureobasidium pullulans]|nr:MAG: Uncharacterized protein AUREO_006960 [Aureobasidium pullulans]
MNHLRSSNEQMVPFADEGDQDCKDAMYENLIVINRMNERIELLRAEVEKRGMRWSEAEVEDRQISERMVNGDSTTRTQPTQSQSGHLTDDELRAQLEARLAQHSHEDQEEEGLHL